MAPSKARKVVATRPFIRQFSQEVIDLILGEVTRKMDLAACSLACSAWAFMARRGLFRSISLTAESRFTKRFEDDNLDDDESADDEASEHGSENSDEDRGSEYQAFLRMLLAFVRFLTTTSAPISAVKTLRIVGEWDPDEGDGEYLPIQGTMLREIVAGLPNLHTLTLAHITVRHRCIAPALAGSSLRTLVLHEVSGIDQISDHEVAVVDFLRLFSIFPSLQELDFCGHNNLTCDETVLEHHLQNTALSRFRQRQRPLDWEDLGRQAHDFLMLLIKASGKAAVHLDVDMVFPEASEGFPDTLFEQVGPLLESLVVRLWWGELDANAILESEYGEIELGLSFCTALRSITLDFHSREEIVVMGPLVDPDLMHRIFQELFEEAGCQDLGVTLDLPSLSSVKETLPKIDIFGPAYVGQGLAKLIILSRGRYLNEENQLQVRKWMPQLSAQGIITFQD